MIPSAFGRRPRGPRLERIERSPRYRDGRFRNTLPARQGPLLPLLREWLFGDDGYREPTAPVPTILRAAEDFRTAPDDVRVTWLGHATLLVELDGRRFLTDPMWGAHASPGRIFGVKRFFEPPLALRDLPDLDAVVLSHDHYDHLDEGTIRVLAERVPRFIAPLGVGAHLESWGVDPSRVTELDWWESADVAGVEVVCTPARHFSGRAPWDRFRTLWCGWAFLGSGARVYFSGDSAMFPGFAEIGERLGPFDLTLLDVGAYDPRWADVHMGPEQAVEAHRMVRGARMLPVHWGTFNLAFHAWTEPAERVIVAAERAEVSLVLPRPGGSVGRIGPSGVERWWPSLPWQTADEAPIVSSGLNGPRG